MFSWNPTIIEGLVQLFMVVVLFLATVAIAGSLTAAVTRAYFTEVRRHLVAMMQMRGETPPSLPDESTRR